jgi:hypothetical protein
MRAERGVVIHPRPDSPRPTPCRRCMPMAARKHTTPGQYFHPDDPGGYLEPGEPLMVGGYDFSWCYVIHKNVSGWTGYSVGTNGSLWSHRIGGVWRRLSPKRDTRGRLQVTLCNNGLTDDVFIHQLVLNAFVGPRPEGLQGCHNNDDHKDNRIVNLRWGTPESNYRDRDRNGKTARGSRAGQSKISESQVLEIRRLAAMGVGRRKLGRLFGIADTTAKSVVKRKSWRHVGEFS